MQQGFSLIELMMVVALIGILSAIVYPNYADNVASTKLVEAHGALTDFKNQAEQYYQDNRTYLNGAACGVTMAATAYKYFTITCAGTAETFTATATATADSGISGFVFTLNQLDAKATTAVASGATAQATCWSKKRNGEC